MTKKLTVYSVLKRIPLIFALTLLANVGAGLVVGSWKASAFNSRIENLEATAAEHKSVPQDIAIIKTKLDTTQRDVEFIKNYILRK